MAPAASVSNRVLIAVIAVTVLFFATYYLILPTMRPIPVPGRPLSSVNELLGHFVFTLGALGAIQALIMLTLKNKIFSIVFWVSVHVIFGVAVAPVLWDVGGLANQDVLEPLQALVLMVATYLIRFANSSIVEFEASKGMW